ncbi:MAG TPA: GyrI-like domain-containing protein [Vicinamibacterales bacterium]|nr:GyrI-like domain-containing protein [Vicinamibacterales bacterium]
MTSSYIVELRDLPGVSLAVVRRVARVPELSRLVPECCGLVWNALKAQGIRGGRHVAVYWDESIKLDVGVELAVPFAEHDGLVRSATPAGAVATTTHFGPYGGLGAAHGAVREWCRANHHPLAGPCWEIYGHWQDAWNADPSKIRTDVFYQMGR